VDTEEGATMRWEASMEKRKRRKFTDEFKREAVRLVKQGDGNVSQVARDLDVTLSSLRKWVKEADIEQGKGPPEALSKAEREELRKLRRRVRTLEEEREILKKATAFFAKESK
jgi:transposase